jgi:hypothetical protein
MKQSRVEVPRRAGAVAQAHSPGARFSHAVLRATADVLTRHVGRTGACVVCGCLWPCDLVVRAESHAAGI